MNKYWLGRKHSEETKKKISESLRGRFMGENNVSKRLEVRQKISKRLSGRKCPWTTERNLKNNPAKKGKENYQWIEDRTKLKSLSRGKERRSYRYSEWRDRVKARDDNKCKIGNNDCKGRIEVHHILGFKEYPELRYEINNGITLCHFHHPRKREEEKNLSPYFQKLINNIKN